MMDAVCRKACYTALLVLVGCHMYSGIVFAVMLASAHEILGPCLKFPLWYSSVSLRLQASPTQTGRPQRPLPAERVYRVLCYNN